MSNVSNAHGVRSCVQIGCDPELFLYDPDAKVPVSAAPLFDGTKTAPEPVLSGFIIHDNVTAEFGFEPATRVGDFVDRVLDMQDEILRRARQRTGNPKIILGRKFGSLVFPKSQLLHPDTLSAGCSTDYNAWAGLDDEGSPIANRPPDLTNNGGLRAAGGHIHIGYLDTHPKLKAMLTSNKGRVEIVKLLDTTVGQLVGLWERADGRMSHIRRRTLYGAAGAFRPKDYGLEWRVPSSAWTTEARAGRVFNAIQKVMAWLNDVGDPAEAVRANLKGLKVTEEDVIRSINTVDPIEAAASWSEE